MAHTTTAAAYSLAPFGVCVCVCWLYDNKFIFNIDNCCLNKIEN